MCGLAGVIEGSGLRCNDGAIGRMLQRIVHRGPDDEGVWREGPVWLGFRRLSIIELSEHGHQPMVSRDGRFVITFNGEIYNHRAMRAELEAHGVPSWPGHSDTRTLVEWFSRFGIEETLKRANGMLGMAVWDRQERSLTLARDRFGEKPMHFAARPEGIAFASELHSLEHVEGLDLDIDRAALATYFSRGYFGAPLTIYGGISQVAPGEMVIWKAGKPLERKRYWSVADAARSGKSRPISDPVAAVEELEQIVKDAVALRMEADVPLGAFLSGGVDSSLVVAMMQASSSRSVKTFTLGFDVPQFNEADFARAVAQHLGTDHIEHIVTVEDAKAIVPKLGSMYDQPFADFSQIPTHLVSQLARREVTVALTGDGGDEMFAGYRRYFATPAMWRGLKHLPFRGMAAATLDAMPADVLKRMLFFLGPAARKYGRTDDLGRTLKRIARWLPAKTFGELYDISIAPWTNPESLVLGANHRAAETPGETPRFADEVEEMCWRDMVNYLPGDILTKVDRASMAVSLETRVPLLDPAVAEFSWRLPASMKMHEGQGKQALRQVLYRHVPRELIERTKMGFSVPLGDWLRGDLKSWAEDLIAPDRLKRQGLLDPNLVQRQWASYQAGQSINDTEIWSVLMLQAWLAERGR